MANPNSVFRNPSSELGPAVSKHVEALLSTVDAARSSIGELDAADHAFLNRSFGDVRADIVAGRCSIESVVRHHIRATVAASLATHCLTAFPWEAALQRARELDRMAEQRDALPLLGLVYSVKDCIHVAGIAVTLGCSSRLDAIPQHSAEIVERLDRLGAIMIAKTACPQAGMSNTTASPMWGLVRSPYGEDYQVGGSSGGEAALVHLRGSMLGVGTDTGGSVRQPAALNELVGFKFSSSSGIRFQQPDDFTNGLPHTTVPATACGLFTRDVDTMTVALRSLGLVGEPSPIANQLGYSTFEGSPEVQSAIFWAVRDDARQVHLLENNADEWVGAWMDAACAYGFDEGLKMIATDPLLPTSMFTSQLPGVKLADALQHVQSLREEFDQELTANGINILIAPSFAYGKPVLDSTFFQSPRAELWMQAINLMEWPALSLPLPVSDSLLKQWQDEKQTSLVAHHPLADMGRVWPKVKDSLCQLLPSQRRATISIQLIVRPGEEARLLSYASELVHRASTAS